MPRPASLLAVAAALVAATCLLAPADADTRATGSAVPRPPVALQTRTARTAESFVESIGVNTHLSYLGTPYADYRAIEAALVELGVCHIRDGLYATDPAELAEIAHLHRVDGISTSFIFDGHLNAVGASGIVALQHAIVAAGDVPALSDIEGPNEWDISYVSQIRPYVKLLSGLWRADPATAGVPIAGPSFAYTWDTPNFVRVGDLTPYIDEGNLHDYPGGGAQLLSSQLSGFILPNESILSGDEPVIATETGYSTAVGGPGAQAGNPAVSLASQAELLPEVFLQSFAAGIRRTYAYELIDGAPNSDYESQYGLLTYGMRPKPAFTTLRDMIAALRDPGPSWDPGSLTYGLSGATSGIHTVLLEKRDGTFVIALWRETAHLDNTPVSLTLRLEDRSSIEERRFDVSGGAVAEAADAGTFTFHVSDDPVFIEVQPG